MKTAKVLFFILFLLTTFVLCAWVCWFLAVIISGEISVYKWPARLKIMTLFWAIAFGGWFTNFVYGLFNKDLLQ